ncbi:MAG: ATP-grasp domain-containing protein, partial [Oscillospiraceae bacterium]|nr:ATP-grasp domain-containing protein [Oscillospiraceae bacterium]
MKQIAVIGASYLQLPLILKAKDMGLVTHVFAWAAGDVGEKAADCFYPISIVEKDQILAECRRIGIDAVVTIGSDHAMLTVSHVAAALSLPCNSPEAVRNSTDKHAMRLAFEKNHDPSPKSILVNDIHDISVDSLHFPVIVKPLDRSGSRGITKLIGPEHLEEAIETAKACGFQKQALIEEFAEGAEYSVESISWQGKHTILAVTEKFTTGSPHFIETGHLEPAGLSEQLKEKVSRTVTHALDSLGITMGAGHSEVKIDDRGEIRIIEIGGRMGGDLIGSDLVPLSIGYDFVKAVIDCALGVKPEPFVLTEQKAAGVRFLFD